MAARATLSIGSFNRLSNMGTLLVYAPKTSLLSCMWERAVVDDQWPTKKLEIDRATIK